MSLNALRSRWGWACGRYSGRAELPGEAGVAEHSGRDMCSLNLCGGAALDF